MRKLKPIRATARPGHIPAPMGGLNTVDGGFSMPETDCPLIYNMIGAENGLRSRLGSQEWCTGLVGIADNTVRSVLPFTGSHEDGSTNRLFACTSKGIYDVSASLAGPALVVTFPTQSGDAGWGIGTVSVNSSGGHFLTYCDEENGYYVYTEATTSWTKVVQAVVAEWVTATVYAAGASVSHGGLTYKTTAGGTSGATAPTGTGAAFNDGGVTDWAYTPSINGVDPATLVFVLVWKNRLWFVQKNSGIAWYLPIGFGNGGSLFGTATPFNFGAQFKSGGSLVGLFSWTVDGGSGPDDRLVAVSRGGDVVIYEGTDPSSANTFGLVGRWSIGGVPAGRRIGTTDGGDVLLMSTTGIIPVSRIVQGKPLVDVSQYSTYKISNLFNRAATTYGNVKGWAMALHPEDNSLIVAIPVADGQNTSQLAMSMITRGWSPYRDLPLLSMAAWEGRLYFGSADGRVLINTGYVDGVLLSDANAFTPIDCSGITRFQNNGRGSQKQIMQARATLISEGGSISQNVEARYRFDLTEAAKPSGAVANPGTATWDSAIWDQSKWAGAYATQQDTGGMVGMGPDFAIAWRLAITSRTVLIGFDFEYIESAGLV